MSQKKKSVSGHLIWILQQLYAGQTGVVRGENRETSRSFDSVLNPRLFCAGLQLAMAVWRGDAGLISLDLRDGSPNPLDLRFADDILLLCNSGDEASWLLDHLVRCCSHVGLLLNMDKTTKILTTEAQPPSQLFTPNGLVVDILSGLTSHKWLGCQLSSMGSANTQNDV